MKRKANILPSVENEFYKNVSFRINIGSMKKMTQFSVFPCIMMRTVIYTVNQFLFATNLFCDLLKI